MERQSGAGNWEAWIKDNRDNELYRIVFMPDNKWWLAQNVKYALKGITINGCDKDSCGRSYTNVEVFAGNFAINQQTICPSGWVLPSNTQWNTMTNNISSNLVIAWQDMRSLQCSCKPITDRYGWATKGRSYLYEQMNDGDVYFSTDGNATHAMEMDQGNGDILTCNNTIYWGGKWGYPALYHVTVRCIHP
jgi:uncharacterized protein (TIGR02145 family)